MQTGNTIADCIAKTSAQLASVTDTPRLEAELLLAHALGMSRAGLLARLRETVDAAPLAPLLARRLDHEPLAYIFGEWEFYGLPFWVQPPLLTPRPETEHLVETVLGHLAAQPPDAPCAVADLCCGTGCVAVAIAHHAPQATLYACDIRADAVETTRRNAQRHNTPVHAAQGDLFAALDTLCSRFDVVASNPPYVPAAEWDGLSPVITKHEDPGALLAGADGLDLVRRIIPGAYARLRDGGMLALELGEDQFHRTATIMDACGFENIQATKDLAGIDRIISGLRIG